MSKVLEDILNGIENVNEVKDILKSISIKKAFINKKTNTWEIHLIANTFISEENIQFIKKILSSIFNISGDLILIIENSEKRKYN